MIEVMIKFRYEKVEGKDNDYYRDKVIDEIYNSDDMIYYMEVNEVD